jgi:hypothetical protein
MISKQQWFTAKTANTPSFTASVKRQHQKYGYEFPVPGPVDRMVDRIEDAWDERKGTLVGTIGAIIIFGVLIFTGIVLVVDAIPSPVNYVVEVKK